MPRGQRESIANLGENFLHESDRCVGQTVCAWCFMPVGNLVAGDVMLAQKIAIERDERAAIAVAVKFETLRVRRATRGGLSWLVS
jgi:hypothetical protein